MQPIPSNSKFIKICAGKWCLDFAIDATGRMLQVPFSGGESSVPAYPTAGDVWTFESALQVVHADGNTSTDLRYDVSMTEGDLTRISLQDPAYPFFVDLYFESFPVHHVIRTWSEIRHEEDSEVVLEKFASSAFEFGIGPYFLTQFHGDWADEVNMAEERLSYGVKKLDSKLGVRAHQFLAPWFLLSKDQPMQEESGEVYGGSLAWSGSFSFEFEVDPKGGLRSLCGMNPHASRYHLAPKEVFKTPPMVWGYSPSGSGDLSRNLQAWVRENALRDGDRTRAILLNNWEATYFDFDEKKIISLFAGAKDLGMELFLLDDGWFGKKFPRDGDYQGLGDWIPDPKKLPNGIGPLARAAVDQGLRFGLWFEPEMVSPGSELFEKHPDWLIQQPKRELDLSRNQMILDLANPEVQSFVFSVVDDMLSSTPEITYIKWDCNRYITQPGSPYLAKDRQSHLWIEYVCALYDIYDKLVEKHPNVEIMMCSGGGGRVDYAASRYAQEIWPSDMTDPAKRIFIQWGYSYFFPAMALSAHVTDMGHHDIKFAFDVAMSGRLGMDMDVDKLSPEDKEFSKRAIETYKTIRDVVQLGTQYRLESPYERPRSAVMYVLDDRAVVFVYSLGDAAAAPLKLKGLDPTATYAIEEINLPDGLNISKCKMTGKLLMESGLPLDPYHRYDSAVFELESENS